MEKKVEKLDAELNKYRAQMSKMRDGPAKVMAHKAERSYHHTAMSAAAAANNDILRSV